MTTDMKRYILPVLLILSVLTGCVDTRQQTQKATEDYILYDLPSPREQQLCNIICDAVNDMEPSVSLPQAQHYTYDEVYNVYQLIYVNEAAVFYLSPQFGYENGSRGISRIKFRYIYTKDEVRKMYEEIDKSAKEILDGIGGESDCEKFKHIHDELIKRCTYGDGKNADNAYGALVEGRALCQGYSKAFDLLCRKASLHAVITEGDAQGSHMWNMVNTDDGYYHIDCTWDDPDDTKRPDLVRYDFFMLNDASIKRGRTITSKAPGSAGVKYDHWAFSELTASTYDDAVRLIKAQAADGTIRLRADSRETYDEIKDRLFGGDGLGEILRECGVNAETIDYTLNDSDYIIEIYTV